jgi:hypothetical protein
LFCGSGAARECTDALHRSGRRREIEKSDDRQLARLLRARPRATITFGESLIKSSASAGNRSSRPFGKPIFDINILTFDVTKFSHALHKSV